MTNDKRQGQIEALVDEAIRHADRGDVVLAEQAIRTLDDLAGRYVGGKFSGGADLVRAARERAK